MATSGAYCLLAHDSLAYLTKLGYTFCEQRTFRPSSGGEARTWNKAQLMKREEAPQVLHFVVVNDPTHDFDLTQEAWIGDQMVAMIYRVGWDSAEQWHVSFFPELEEGQECELSWEVFQRITQTFTAFREEMTPKM
jgi:hypothetical protein